MKKVIVYGIGEYYNRLYWNGDFQQYDVLALCDSDSSKWDKEYHGIPIIPPCRIKEYAYDEVLVSTTNLDGEEIKLYLQKDWNIPEDLIRIMTPPKDKYAGELGYWRERYYRGGNRFNVNHSWYEKLMLAIAREQDDSFWKGKVVADFGCGPLGSLCWSKSPYLKIGIDVLASRYFEHFLPALRQHGMMYVTCTEDYIPIPDAFVDFLCTTNSLDHVDNFEEMCSELLRILKPGGELIASFNLNEPSTECEPQTFTRDRLQNVLLHHFDILSCRQGESNDKLIDNVSADEDALDFSSKMVLWVRARKRNVC